MFRKLAAIGLTTVLFALAQGVQATTLPLSDSFTFPGTEEFKTVNLTQKENNPNFYYYELFNAGLTDLYTKITLVSAVQSGTGNDTQGEPFGYAVFKDSYVPTDGSNGYETSLLGAIVDVKSLSNQISNNTIQSFGFLMLAGQQYVLALGKNGNDWQSITTEVSAVPLPGAVWLFGSALLAFFGFTNRRKA